MNTSEEKVSNNAKQIVIITVGIVGALVGAFVAYPNEISKEVVIGGVTGLIGFIAGAADKLWGR